MTSQNARTIESQLSVDLVRSEVRPTVNFIEFCQASRLAHDRYVTAGLMKRAPSKSRLFLRDLLPGSVVFVAAVDDCVIGTVSGNIYGPGTLPLMDLYPGQLQSLADSGRIAAEGTKLACAEITGLQPSGFGGLSVTSVELLKSVFRWCLVSGITDWLIVIHPRVQDFYEKELGFVAVGEMRSCPHVANEPGVLLKLDMTATYAGKYPQGPVTERYFVPRVKGEQAWSHRYRLRDYEVALLLMDNAELLSQPNSRDFAALAQSFPHLNLAERLQELVALSSGTESLHRPLLLPSTVQLSASFEGVRPESRLEFSPVCFALRAHLRRLEIVLTLEAASHGSALTLTVDDDVPDGILADPHLIGRVLLSGLIDDVVSSKGALCLSSNSERALPPKVTIHVTGRLGIGDCFELTFAIAGLPHRVSARTKNSIQIMSGVIIDEGANECSAHSLEFSIPATRTEFATHLAFDRAGMSAVEFERGLDEATQDLPPLRVLVVEDNVVNQVVVRKLLSKVDAEVVIAGDGIQALEYSDAEHFDLILMDIQLPKLDGFETTRAIRHRASSRNRTTPIHAMTAFVLKDDEQRCLTAGMDGFIPKPITYQSMLSLICSLRGRGVIDYIAAHEAPI